MIFDGPYRRAVMTAESPTGPGPDHRDHVTRAHLPVLDADLEPGRQDVESRMPSASVMPSGTR